MSVKEIKVRKMKEDHSDEVTTSKVDKVADEVIKVFIVKRGQRMIDKDDPIDNIAYEESEARLILMGIIMATFLAITLSIMVFQFDPPKKIEVYTPTKEPKMNSLSPHVAIMGLPGDRYMFTLKQNKNSSFQFGWELRLPKVPGSHFKSCKGSTGYFVFTDQKAVFVISSSMNQKMTMINGPSKHVTLPKSQIIDRFYFSGSILRVGNFALVFGGKPLEKGLSAYSDGAKLECSPITAIWSIKRQTWIQGPALPPRFKDCISVATGFSVNRTVGVILADREEFDEQQNRCIYAYTFSSETFQWGDTNECLIQPESKIELHTYMTCASFFDNSFKL